MKKYIRTEITVIDTKVNVINIENDEYISLTDLARYVNPEEPKIPIYSWIRNKEVIRFIGLWEKLNNENFKGHEFETFENEAGKNSFYMSPQKWIKETNAIGIISKSGNNGGTYAHADIALEFASWLSPEFKLYLIKEFERLKKEESYLYKIDWQASRILSKVNYVVHTNAIKNNIVPTLTERQKQFVYANEADVLNVALFGMTAKEWRTNNSELAKKGNIRDYTDLVHLVILSNLENLNSEYIRLGVNQKERLIKLNSAAIFQMESLKNTKNIKDLEILQKQVNESKLSNKIDNDKLYITNEID